MSWYNFLTKSELVERAQEVPSEKQAIQEELQERAHQPENEREWSQLSDEEKQAFIETAPGWPGWIF